MYYVLDGLPPLSEREPIGPPIEFPLFFGTTLFAIEAVGVVSYKFLNNNNIIISGSLKLWRLIDR